MIYSSTPSITAASNEQSLTRQGDSRSCWMTLLYGSSCPTDHGAGAVDACHVITLFEKQQRGKPRAAAEIENIRSSRSQRVDDQPRHFNMRRVLHVVAQIAIIGFREM